MTAFYRCTVGFLLVAALMCGPGAGAAAAGGADDTLDRGFRLQLATGYPALVGGGLGWKFESDTEILVTGGIGGLWAVLAGSGELQVAQDVVDWGGGEMYGAWTGSVVSAYFPVIDCYGNEVAHCDDRYQTFWWTGPRYGARFRLGGSGLFGGGTYFDVNAGPLAGFCRGDCERGVRLSVAVNLRLTMPFAPR